MNFTWKRTRKHNWIYKLENWLQTLTTILMKTCARDTYQSSRQNKLRFQPISKLLYYLIIVKFSRNSYYSYNNY